MSPLPRPIPGSDGHPRPWTVILGERGNRLRPPTTHTTHMKPTLRTAILVFGLSAGLADWAAAQG